MNILEIAEAEFFADSPAFKQNVNSETLAALLLCWVLSLGLSSTQSSAWLGVEVQQVSVD